TTFFRRARSGVNGRITVSPQPRTLPTSAMRISANANVPDVKSVWSKKIRQLLGSCVEDTRQKSNGTRSRAFKFAPLEDCRRKFERHAGAPNIEWEPTKEEDERPNPAKQTNEDVSGETPREAGDLESEPAIEPDDAPELEWEPEIALDDAPELEWEPAIEP